MRGVNINHAEFEDAMFTNKQITDFKCEAVSVNDQDVLCVSIELARGVEAATAISALGVAIKRTFESTATIVVLESGTIAREFESNVKAPRFQDNR